MNRPLRRSRASSYQLRFCFNFIADGPARCPRPEDGWHRVPGKNVRGRLAECRNSNSGFGSGRNLATRPGQRGRPLMALARAYSTLRDRRQACSRARGVRPRVTVIQEGRDTTVREIDTDSSNPTTSAIILGFLRH
jgi:hypothetical protein